MKNNQTLLFMMALLGCVFSNDIQVCQRSANMVVNGGFEQNGCIGKEQCVWNVNIQPYSPDYLPGWTPQPEIEIGTGYRYNSAFGRTWVIDLDSDKNTCI